MNVFSILTGVEAGSEELHASVPLCGTSHRHDSVKVDLVIECKCEASKVVSSI